MIDLSWGIQKNNLRAGFFHLGRFKTAANIAAVCWAIYLITFMCFPASMPVSEANTVVIFPLAFVVASVS
jgi:uncharacterized protein with PQ loop repeat